MNIKIIKALPEDTIVELLKTCQKELQRRRREKTLKNKRKKIKDINIKEFETIEKAREGLNKHNSNSLLELRCLNEKETKRKNYLNSLINQDWGYLFNSETYSNEKKYYVYAHVDPTSRIFTASKKCGGNYGGLPFYIGKGTGNRAYVLKRNQGHGKKIRNLLTKGYSEDDIVHILKSDLTESQAYELESKLIYFFGTKYQENRKYGTLYNLDIPAIPEFFGIMQKPFTRKSFEAKKYEAKQQKEPS